LTRGSRTLVDTTCAICERTLLVGERALRFAPNQGGELVDVCQLCADEAVEQGWVKEGSPTSPTVAPAKRRRRLSLSAIFDPRRTPPGDETVAPEPILRRLSEPELAMVDAADLFNASSSRRTIAGIAKSLGPPKASIVPLSGVNTEVVITVAWDISWYQYRVTVDSAQPVRLEERGLELSEVDRKFQVWNASLDRHGRLMPEIARV
jgi:hypothetical protein